MPIKGLLLIVLAVVVIAFLQREEIYSWIEETKHEDEQEEYDDDVKEDIE